MTGPAVGGARDAVAGRLRAGTAGRLLATADIGSATTAAALVGRLGDRRRLLAAAAVPGGSGPDALVELLCGRVSSSDPGLAASVGIVDGRPPADLPTLVSRTEPPPRIAVVAATEEVRAQLEAAASLAGWLTAGASAARREPVSAVRLATRPGIDALLVGSADPPEADERGLLEELLAVAGAVAARRPGLPIVLSGGIGRSAAGGTGGVPGLHVVLAPGPAAGGPPGSDLRELLVDLRAGPDDGRRALARSAASLARVLGQAVELIDIGFSGALRAVAIRDPAKPAGVHVDDVDAPTGALLALDAPGAIDRVEAWSTFALDRARLRDRLAELHRAPWSDLAGDGAPLRAAALRASLERLPTVRSLPAGGAPGLIVATGAFGALPGPGVALVLADLLCRPGVAQLALDAARLLAPLGTVRDDSTRDALVAELAEDLLVPLGTVVAAHGARPGRPAGRVIVDADGAAGEIDLEAGGLTLVDLPPGEHALADLRFRSVVDLGAPGRHFVVPVAGGLAGLLVDLRDLPEHLPTRPDERRELLAGWEQQLWPERAG